MLKVFRHKGVAKKVLWVIATIIIISFGFGFGISRYANQDQSNAVAGKVFGQNISLKDLRAAAMAARDQIILMSGPDFQKALSRIDMDNEAWTRILLLKEADKRGIKATDSEVIAYIRSLPSFSSNGAFDRRIYKTIVAQVFRRDLRAFEESMRDQIRILKILQPVVNKIQLSDAQIREEYEKRNRKVKVGYVLIEPQSFAKDIAVDAQEVKSYFDGHREEFLIPESIKLQYVTLPLTEKSTTDDHTKAQATAQEIYQTSLNGGDFTATAKAKGLVAKETGFFSMEEPDLSLGWTLELWQQAFTVQSGTVLAPITTANGIVVARVADRKTAYIPEFDKAQDTVKEKILAERTSALAKDKAKAIQSDIAKKITAGKAPSMAARDTGLSLKETPFFSMGEYLPEIGISEDFDTAALALNDKNLLSDVVQTPKGPAILWWEASQPVDEKKFEEDKKDFTRSLYQYEQAKAVDEVVTEIRGRAQLESYLGNLKK